MTLLDGQSTLFDHPALDGFHPAVRAWFAERFPDGPSPPQIGGWPAIAARQDTLIAAPTGSGKTLTGFLVAIDRLYRAHAAGEAVTGRLRVVYVSPLRALAVDIKENLERPLQEIASVAKRLGLPAPELKVAVRTGDTTSAARAALVRKPPNLLVTTPESLYLLLTAPRSRRVLATVDTVIVDEIHALARDKRGSHLALSLERLELVTAERPVRIGLSATQKPIETVARLLVGSRCRDDRTPACAVVDVGHRRRLDLALELPDGELEAIASAEQFADALDRVAELVDGHRTTLVFVNTRNLAERVAHQLGERLGDEVVAAHHGSLSKDRRQRVEARLRAGELRALVATASLELGIDVGPVDLVCQLGSPRSLATFLQRVGRSGHNRYGVPKGRIFPLTRDELVECAALLIGVGKGRLDALEPPQAPLDILAQQLVAEAATERSRLDELFALARRSAPYAGLDRDTFDRVVQLVADGVPTGRGPKGDHVHLDRINGEVSGRRGARLAAVTSGGAIPELADYRVVADPDELLVGTVNEEWATESTAGDVFLLGTHTWRIRRIEPGVVRVVDAEGAEPTVPFWRGEAPGRTRELSEEVSELRAVVDGYLAAGDADGARRWLVGKAALPEEAAVQLVAYLAATRAVLGLVPTRRELVIERFFDESGGMQLVVHCPYGARVNRAFGLALRKRFCVTFDFELQAAASDDALVLSLGPQHSFDLASVPRFLRADTVESVLRQAVLVPPSPMFVARWRWNLNRALVVLRWKGGRKHPPAIQRMEADDVMATVFPQAAACQENVSGPLEIPDHPLVAQTMQDTLTEAMDVAGLRALLAAIEDGSVQVHCRDTVEPSPMSHEILVGKPYTFLDDGEAADRRTRQVKLRRGLPVSPDELGRLEPTAIARVEAEVAPDPRSPDELHDVLMALVCCTPRPGWQRWFDQLRDAGRARAVPVAGALRWCATEALALLAVLHPGSVGELPPGLAGGGDVDAHDVATRLVRGRLDHSGPMTEAELAAGCGLTASQVAVAVAALEAEGFAIRGHFRSAAARREEADGPHEWCARRVLARIHVASQRSRRKAVEPATAAQFMQFLFRWQHVDPEHRLHGEDAVAAAVEQLQGWHAPAAAWEGAILADRIGRYHPDQLDRLGHAGLVTWGRLATAAEATPTTSAADGADQAERGPGGRLAPPPSRSCTRADLPWLLAAARPPGSAPTIPDGTVLASVVEALRGGGARLLRAAGRRGGRSPGHGGGGTVGRRGPRVLSADSFWALRSLFASRRTGGRPHLPATAVSRPTRGRFRRGVVAGRASVRDGGRCCSRPPADLEPDELAEAVAEQLLCRWGWCSETSPCGSRSPCRGGSSNGRCAGWRRAAPSAAAASSAASVASSTPCPKRPTPSLRSGGERAPRHRRSAHHHLGRRPVEPHRHHHPRPSGARGGHSVGVLRRRGPARRTRRRERRRRRGRHGRHGRHGRRGRGRRSGRCGPPPLTPPGTAAHRARPLAGGGHHQARHQRPERGGHVEQVEPRRRAQQRDPGGVALRRVGERRGHRADDRAEQAQAGHRGYELPGHRREQRQRAGPEHAHHHIEHTRPRTGHPAPAGIGVGVGPRRQAGGDRRQVQPGAPERRQQRAHPAGHGQHRVHARLVPGLAQHAVAGGELRRQRDGQQRQGQAHQRTGVGGGPRRHRLDQLQRHPPPGGQPQGERGHHPGQRRPHDAQPRPAEPGGEVRHPHRRHQQGHPDPFRRAGQRREVPGAEAEQHPGQHGRNDRPRHAGHQPPERRGQPDGHAGERYHEVRADGVAVAVLAQRGGQQHRTGGGERHHHRLAQGGAQHQPGQP
ncbi:MAG: DEAD/DEAH box helicase [Acidimicrobiales bacterium]